jgi:hypothetical protein
MPTTPVRDGRHSPDIAFDERNKHRVTADCDVRNDSVVTLLERLTCDARPTICRAPGGRASESGRTERIARR